MTDGHGRQAAQPERIIVYSEKGTEACPGGEPVSIQSTMAVLYAQTGLAAPLVSATTNAPQAALAMSQALATEMAKQQMQHVEKSEPKSEGSAINTDARDQGQQGAQFGSRRRRRPPFVPQEEEEPRPSGSPLVGNLLNVRV